MIHDGESAQMMKPFDETHDSIAGSFWAGHGQKILKAAIPVMAVSACLWLLYEFYRLLCQPSHIGDYVVHPGAIDLKIFHRYVNQWVSGKTLQGTVYPPASHVLLWPFLGWLDIRGAIWMWAATSVASLAWIVRIVIKESQADTGLERLFVALIPLSMYAAGATIGNGQLILHLLPLIIAGILLLNQKNSHWGSDFLASIMILGSLVKPTVSAPFFWIVLFVTGRLRPAMWVIAGYVFLTIFAVLLFVCRAGHTIGELSNRSFLLSLVGEFTEPLKTGASASLAAGEANLAIWAAKLGLGESIIYASLTVLFLLGLWVFLHRKADLWVILGVTAIVARFWTYHRWYDDMLILLPMVSLFRLTKSLSISHADRVMAGYLLGLTLCLMIAPGGLYLFPPPWNMIWVNIQSAVWVATLLFLTIRAGKQATPGLPE